MVKNHCVIFGKKRIVRLTCYREMKISYFILILAILNTNVFCVKKALTIVIHIDGHCSNKMCEEICHSFAECVNNDAFLFFLRRGTCECYNMILPPKW
uniref:Late nodulin n=1 Tax=Strongyloides papillosus TaxID=174720 RepID=A0A0N5BB39_STREA